MREERRALPPLTEPAPAPGASQVFAESFEESFEPASPFPPDDDPSEEGGALPVPVLDLLSVDAAGEGEDSDRIAFLRASEG